MRSRNFGILITLILLVFMLDTTVLAGTDSYIMGEILANDFRISHMGPDGNKKYYATYPAVAFNSERYEYLVVWAGLFPEGSGSTLEIFGQRINSVTGKFMGEALRISYMGPYADPDYSAGSPAVAYNPNKDDFLVVWHGTDDAGSLHEDEYEIWGQRLSYNDYDNLYLKGDRLRISDMGPDGVSTYRAANPAVVYDNKKKEYLVVWEGEDDTPPLVDDETEIFGQYLQYSPGTLYHRGTDFRISTMGFNGETRYDAHSPDIAYNENSGDFLIVWHGDNHTLYQDDENEIWACLILPDGTIKQTYIISLMGGVYDNNYNAYDPAVTYNPDKDEWLIVWWGNQDLLYGFPEYEIFGQFIKYSSESYTLIGDKDFRISDMGLEGYGNYSGEKPDVAYDSKSKLYLVVWHGDDNERGLAENEEEIFGQVIDAQLKAEIGRNDFRLSDMGPDGDEDYDAAVPAVAYSSTDDNFLVVWAGDDNIPPLVEGEGEIFGQFYSSRLKPVFMPLVVK